MNRKQIEKAVQALKQGLVHRFGTDVELRIFGSVARGDYREHSARGSLRMNEDLIRYRQEKSRETLEDAHILFRAGRLFSALNRIYYSVCFMKSWRFS